MDSMEQEILSAPPGQYGHVSVERLLSGPGLLAIATTLAKMKGQIIDVSDPEAFRRVLRRTSALFIDEAILIFSSVLGSAAGNLALTLLTGGRVIIFGWTRAAGCGHSGRRGVNQ